MKPYYEDTKAGIVIYHGDNRKIAPLLGEFDLLLTDPPYGHGDKWAGGTWASNPIYEAAFEWDAAPIELGWLLSLIKRAPMAMVWGGNYYSLPPSRCWLSWEKTSRMATLADFELAWTNLDRPAKAFLSDRNPDGKRQHPTQKPLNLMSWCLSHAPDAKTVFDPWMGSGTTLVAAKLRGIKATGIEINEQYCEIAAARLAQEVLFPV